MDTTWCEVRISLCHGHSYTIGLKIWLSFGIPIRFVLRPTSSRLRYSGVFNDDLSIVTTNRIGERIKGKVTLDKSNGEFECTVLPRSRGQYKVNIQWKGDHIRGSPFNINIIAPPLPENVDVHCLIRSVVVGRESKFWIDTSRAGPDLLSSSVCGPDYPFKVHLSSDPANPWTIMSQFCPTHTGDYAH